MSKIRSSGNKDTELTLIKILRTNNITGWRRHAALPGKPDFIFPKHRVVVFVDGCFWHFCPKHGRRPGSNTDYWLPKLLRNQRRDREVNRALKEKRWHVVRVWEHELKKGEHVARRLLRAFERAPLKRTTVSDEMNRR